MNDFTDIKALILGKGFDLCGVTDGKSLMSYESVLTERIKNERQTEFEERNIKKRIDPKLYLQDYKSIITVGLNYNLDFNYKSNIFKLSKSSFGIDYHIIIRELLNEISEELHNKTGYKFLPFVDTVGLLERELAVDSGIGFYGKNASVINEEIGSFFFIGEILTDLSLEKGTKMDSKCGECDLCIKACPAGALSEDGYSAKKCISYITQKKGILTNKEGELIGKRIYGCDICQDVCKFNVAIPKVEPEVLGVDKVPQFEISDIFAMSNKAFKKKYGMIPASWRGKHILKRNLIYNIVNTGAVGYYDMILKSKDDTDLGVLEAVAYSRKYIDDIDI